MPLFEITEEDKKLPGFDWKIYKRPLSKYDIFERSNADEREALMKTEKKKNENQLEQ
jgi:hypothetical protein